jgi:hypothetical protein
MTKLSVAEAEKRARKAIEPHYHHVDDIMAQSPCVSDQCYRTNLGQDFLALADLARRLVREYEQTLQNMGAQEDSPMLAEAREAGLLKREGA